MTIVINLFSVHTAKSANPVYHKCVESGLGYKGRSKWGTYNINYNKHYNIEYIFETKTDVSCAHTATKDALELAIKETVDTLARLGTDAGSIAFRHPDGWQTYMTIEQVRNNSKRVVGSDTTETSGGIIVWDHYPRS